MLPSGDVGVRTSNLYEEYTARKRNACVQTQVHWNPKYQALSFHQTVQVK